MPDPFDALRSPAPPIDPDPSFATRLRARLEQALRPTRGVTVSDPTPDVETTEAPAPVTGVVPYLAVTDAPRALAWYVEALGARRRGEPIVMPDGRIGHAELEIAGGVVMLSEEHPEIGVSAPEPGQGAAVTLHATVDDVDALAARAVDAGATLERPPADHPYGRNAVLRDPFGHRWLLSSELAAAAPAPRPGDIGYVSLWVPDVERAASFYSAVLGWRYAPGSAPQGRQVVGGSTPHGLWGGQERSTLFLCFAVDDVALAGERVRDAGGRAGEPRHEPYGVVADCADDQGMAFALVQSPVHGAPPGPRGSATGAGHGDLAYVTMEVTDSERARRFYGSVLGWRFSPGHAEGGWQVEDVVPMVGLIGGQDQVTAVPMYRVDDVYAAVERVRAAGGTASDPERQPYGVTSSCADDQGTRFYLGEL